MEADHIGSRTGKIVNVSDRILYHQMYVKWETRGAAQAFDHRCAQCQIRYKQAVHHIDVKPVGPGILHPFELFPHPRKVAR